MPVMIHANKKEMASVVNVHSYICHLNEWSHGFRCECDLVGFNGVHSQLALSHVKFITMSSLIVSLVL